MLSRMQPCGNGFLEESGGQNCYYADHADPIFPEAGRLELFTMVTIVVPLPYG
jgi:hypothetical protein